MRHLILLLSLTAILPFSTHAETWGDIGEPKVMDKDQVMQAFIKGACQHLKLSVSQPGETWYLSDDAGPVKYMAKSLDDAVYIKTCNSLWGGEQGILESVKYAGPFPSTDTAVASDLLTKYGKTFATYAIAGYIGSLETFNCSAPPSLPEKNEDALRSTECGKSIASHEEIVSSFLPECESGKLAKEACDLIRSVQEQTATLKRKRDVLLSLESSK